MLVIIHTRQISSPLTGEVRELAPHLIRGEGVHRSSLIPNHESSPVSPISPFTKGGLRGISPEPENLSGIPSGMAVSPFPKGGLRGISPASSPLAPLWDLSRAESRERVRVRGNQPPGLRLSFQRCTMNLVVNISFQVSLYALY